MAGPSLNDTPVRTIRLGNDYLAALDAIADWHHRMTGMRRSRRNAVEFMLLKLASDWSFGDEKLRKALDRLRS